MKDSKPAPLRYEHYVVYGGGPCRIPEDRAPSWKEWTEKQELIAWKLRIYVGSERKIL